MRKYTVNFSKWISFVLLKGLISLQRYSKEMKRDDERAWHLFNFNSAIFAHNWFMSKTDDDFHTTSWLTGTRFPRLQRHIWIVKYFLYTVPWNGQNTKKSILFLKRAYPKSQNAQKSMLAVRKPGIRLRDARNIPTSDGWKPRNLTWC